jgi:predicted anti-sigma-YlaC factor YlaD
MICLNGGPTAERIYAYLDREIEGAELRAFEGHLAACASCRQAVEARRLIAAAAESLPAFQVPDGFAASVLARLGTEAGARKPARRRIRIWAAAAAGLALIGGTGWVLISGRSLSDVVLEASRFLWGNVRGLATLAAKSYSYAALAVKILGKLGGQVLEGFRVLSSFIGPEVQIACLCAALALAAAGFAVWRRKSGLERNHEEP